MCARRRNRQNSTFVHTVGQMGFGKIRTVKRVPLSHVDFSQWELLIKGHVNFQFNCQGNAHIWSNFIVDVIQFISPG